MADLRRTTEMHVTFSIDRMRERDLLQVVDIEEASGLNRWGYDSYRREMLKNPTSVLLVARSSHTTDSEVIGFFAGWTVEDEMHVNNIAAHPGYRRMGIGKSLMQTAIDIARPCGVKIVVLEVRASNESAQSLYRKLGFRFVARRRDYYRFPTEDAMVMKLAID
ncbi:MAG: ribosomal-protein-alanine N-acetyltransferase [Blastocatellia bacterium AA13]|nr:MAG: ribosomal-protein-alanine N-acetyltransferase [Blastocatellia bacterium AA13]